MKTMCPAGYHHNGFVATHALGHTKIYMHIFVNIYIYVASFFFDDNIQYLKI